MKATTFLVVDDKPDNLLVLRTVLRTHFSECEVLTAGSAPEGLALAADNSVDCGVIDVQMPLIDGVEMCRRLKASEATSRFPVILITAHQSTAESRARALEAGADDFLSRPIDNVELVAKVNVMLRIKHVEDKLRNSNARLEELVFQRTEALQRSEKQYRTLIHDLHLGVAQMDREHNIVMVNESLAKLLHKPSSELVGKQCYREFEKRETVCEHCPGVPAMETGESRIVKTHGVLDDGSIVYVRNQAFPTYDPDDKVNGFVELIEDMTDRKKAEEEQLSLERQLRHAQKMEAVGQLASGVAHEFNNLLFGILGSAELVLASSKGKLPEHVKRPLEDIKKCGQRGAALTKQLLTFARMKNSEVSLFDVNRVVADDESVLRQLIGERIVLETTLASELPPIQANKDEIAQAIMNLASNARDAMPEGGTLTIQTTTVTLDEARSSGDLHTQPGLYVQLSVADSGCGMAPETVERVFEPFFTTKPVGKGTGLGLSTVFADVTKNGGFIEVESRQGEGTVFRIYLPAAEGTVVASPSVEADRLAGQDSGGGETILVCDDDEVVLDSAAFLLESKGYSVIRAGDAGAALEAAASHDGTIDLLLTDVTMPGMNGWQLARNLTGQRPDMKVILMSGYAEDVLDAGAADDEHVEFLQKPPESDTLFRRIREVLDAPGRSEP